MIQSTEFDTLNTIKAIFIQIIGWFRSRALEKSKRSNYRFKHIKWKKIIFIINQKIILNTFI